MLSVLLDSIANNKLELGPLKIVTTIEVSQIVKTFVTSTFIFIFINTVIIHFPNK